MTESTVRENEEEILYASETTRVVRASERGVVFKQYLGAQAQRRLRQEREILARLVHAHGVVQPAPFRATFDKLVLRDDGAQALSSVLRAGECDMALALSLAVQLARVLGEVHQAGVIHRDINPANILVAKRAQAILIDFDLAVFADHLQSVPAEGRRSDIVGTLGYLAPEQTGRTGNAVDQRSDLYALGVTFYEMTTGRLPFEAQDTLELIRDHLLREPAPPSSIAPDVPAGFSAIIMRLMAKEPQQRYESLERRVQTRTRELEQMQTQLVATARRAGMAEIANNVLHNVGNVLNSVNVSASIVRRTIGTSRIGGLSRAVDLMKQHEGNLAAFLDADERGRTLLAYLGELVGALASERDETLEDLDRLTRSVDHIIYIVGTQQTHSGPANVMELVTPTEVFDQALQLSELSITRYGMTVVRQVDDTPPIALDKQRLLQILVNLIGNSAQAMAHLPVNARLLTLGATIVGEGDSQRLHLTVRDEGEGIPPESIDRIFAHGFTTRTDGHGFGLHSSALAAMEMGGKLSVHSEGVGRGATFTIDLPIDSRVSGSGAAKDR